MKIFTSTQLKDLDKFTIEHENIESIDLMERAAKAITKAIIQEWDISTPIIVFAGPGNNGGDALAVARLLIKEHYEVKVILFNIDNNLSEDCKLNKERLTELKNFTGLTEITTSFTIPEISIDTLIIDGLFGTGLKRPLAGGFATLIRYINQSPAKVVSIDLPSGLLAEDNTNNVRTNIINADLTLTIHQKKLSFLFEEAQQFIGKVKVLDISLNKDYINKTNSIYSIVELNNIKSLICKRNDFVNKGTMGTALLIAGSYSMAGAAILCTRACLRAGVGKVITHTPKRNYDVMLSSVPEAILQIDHEETYFSQAVDTENIDALGIGPGLGRNENSAIATIAQIKGAKCPIVVDADALNILSKHRTWLQQIPKFTIITPHSAEFDRLIGIPSTTDYERLEQARQLAQNLQIIILLKGHYSALCLPNGKVFFNSTGNSGMATAGSGDVLTGIITGLLARGYNRIDACKVGLFLHGLSGDLAIKDIGKESLIASDIINYMPKAFKYISE